MTLSTPDGGWGWVVSLAAFISCVIVDGVKYSFGIIFIELLNTFQSSKSETSLIMSIQIGSTLLSGPVTGALVNRFGCIKVTAVGTIIAFIGFLASAFATSLVWLYITFGLMGGVGFCMMNIPPFILITRYFNKHLALAIGIGAMGAGVGTLVFNPVSKILIDQYTWRGTLLIEAGFVLNGLVVASVLRPPPADKDCPDTNSEIENKATSRQTDKNDQSGFECEDYELNRNLLDKKLVQKSNDCSTNGYSVNHPDKELLKYDVSDTVDTNEGVLELKRECDSKLHAEESECEELVDDTSTDLTTTDTFRNQQSQQKRWFSLEPLRNPGFILMIVSSVLAEMAVNTPFAFLPDMMIHKGFEQEQAVWVMFIIGVLGTIGRGAIGFIADLPCINRVYLCNSVHMIKGVLLILSPFCFNYASFVAFGVLFGFAAGSSNVMRGVLLPELFGKEFVAELIGITMFFSSIAAFAGLPKVGALFDATGSYIPPFIMSGCELFLSAVLIFTIPSVLRRRGKHRSYQPKK